MLVAPTVSVKGYCRTEVWSRRTVITGAYYARDPTLNERMDRASARSCTKVGLMDSGMAISGGVLFGPNASGKTYISLDQHRGVADDQKSTWHDGFARPAEYELFSTADAREWLDEKGNYWAVHNGGLTVLGSRGEHIAKFPRTSNNRDPWHGYPVSPKRRGLVDLPPDYCVERWEATEAIDRVWARRIRGFKV